MPLSTPTPTPTPTTKRSPPYYCSPTAVPSKTTTTTTTTTARRTNQSLMLTTTLKHNSSHIISNRKKYSSKLIPFEAVVLLFACASAFVSFLILHYSATTITTTSSTSSARQQQQHLTGHDGGESSFTNKNNNNIPVFPHSGNPHSAVSLLARSLPKDAVIHHIIGPHHHQNPTNNHNNKKYYAGTIVSAYFRLKSKYSSAKYEQEWMQHFLSLQDPMVIYTSRTTNKSTTATTDNATQQQPPDIVELIAQQRQHAPTVIIELQQLSDMPIAYLNYYFNNNNNNHSPSSSSSLLNENKKNNNTLDAFPFWQYQLQIDPERKRHQSYQLFWIWLSKTWFVQQAVQHNFFQTDFFVWSDIGCFRRKQYHGKLLLNAAAIQHVMPNRQTLLWMAHHDTNPPAKWLWNDKYTQKEHFYHSGSQGAGYAAAWTTFLPRLADTLDAFIVSSAAAANNNTTNNNANMFVGEDQCLLQATCLRYADNCAYVPTQQVPDNHYFGLRYVLHHYNQQRPPQYKLWRPPPATAAAVDAAATDTDNNK